MYIDEKTLSALCEEWAFPTEVIQRVLEVNMNDVDATRMYLNFMDVEMSDNPADCWGAWCEMNDMTDQLYKNPFIEGSL